MNKKAEIRVSFLVKVRILCLIFILFAISFALGQQAAGAENNKVLFIGNSLTAAYYMPDQVAQICEELGVIPKVETFSVIAPGRELDFHWRGRGLQTIRQGGWQIVVLQGHSYEPLRDYQMFAAAAKNLAREAQLKGAEVLYYETWGLREEAGKFGEEWSGGDFFSMQARLRSAYAKIASDTGGRVVPVGDAWETAVREHPEIHLQAWDGMHPTNQGSLLTALVFVASITGRDLRTSKWLPSVGVTEEEAAILREIAQRTVANH